ncbi:MAG: transglutaminase family protein [Rikenellaceae bacterium]
MNNLKRYKFSYQTIVSYKSMVSAYHFLLRCTPCDIPSQHLSEHQLHLLAPAKISSELDTFGNIIHYGYFNESHDIFVIASNGIVECGDYRIEEPQPKPYYRSESHLTQMDRAIAEFGNSIFCEGTPLEVSLALSSALYDYMSYSPGKTSVSTTASNSFAYAEGVCQDFSHILLALCRNRGFYARYVVGFLIGTGETHAWIEVWSEGVWYGIDPTHNRKVERGYIKLSHGRDASDCSVVRGSKRGLSSHTTQIRVVVEEM